MANSGEARVPHGVPTVTDDDIHMTIMGYYIHV